MKRSLNCVLCATTMSVAVLGLIGCGGGGHKTAPVSGTVTVGGQPQANVIVVFTPESSGTTAPPGSTGRTDASGKFTLRTPLGQEGAVVGKHTVRIEADVASDDESGNATPVTLPPKARDGTLTFDVPANGTTAADFAL
jgi:hypothetical protein